MCHKKHQWYFLRGICIAILITVILNAPSNLYSSTLPISNQSQLTSSKQHSQWLRHRMLFFGLLSVSSIGLFTGIVVKDVFKDIEYPKVIPNEYFSGLRKISDFDSYKNKLEDKQEVFLELIHDCKKISEEIQILLDKYIDDVDYLKKIERFSEYLYKNQCQHMTDLNDPITFISGENNDQDWKLNLNRTSFLLGLSGLSFIITAPIFFNYLFKCCHQKKGGGINDGKRKLFPYLFLMLFLSMPTSSMGDSYSDILLSNESSFKDLLKYDSSQSLNQTVYNFAKKLDAIKVIESSLNDLDIENENRSTNFIFMSDPQLPWSKYPLARKETLDQGVITNQAHLSSMAILINSTFAMKHLEGIIINGDLTAFAHAWQWDLFRRLYQPNHPDAFVENMGIDIYPGLGNHDYENNVMDCSGPWFSFMNEGKNWCARKSLDHLTQMLKELKIKNFHKESLSYAWDHDQFHFVQLNNSPDYEDRTIGIESSYEWLQNDLMNANEHSRKIILNLHKPYISAKLRMLIKDYPIIGVFYGHIHERIGKNLKLDSSLGTIYGYYCGSASHNLYNFVKLYNYKMEIYSMNSTTGRPVIVDFYTQAFDG